MTGQMIPAYAVEIATPKKVELNGLWFGPKRARTAFIYVHGLGSSLWRPLPFALAKGLAGPNAAFLSFNNRGHDRVSSLQKKSKMHRREWAGGGMEVFTDCVDDIEGAIRFSRRQGAREIYLVGHSTGCQKSVYWAHKKGRGVKGLILLAPMSDYAAALKISGHKRLSRAARIARTFVRRGTPHEILPRTIWPSIDDAQRFISLYTPDSKEEMFTYAQKGKKARIFSSVRLPILAVFAERDEYGDRPAKEIAAWFTANAHARLFQTRIVAGAMHGFKGQHGVLVRKIREFIRK